MVIEEEATVKYGIFATMVLLAITGSWSVSAEEAPVCKTSDCVLDLPLSERIKFSGHFRMRDEYDYYTDYTGMRNPIYLRLRPNVTFKSTKDMDVVVEPQFSKAMGETIYTANSSGTNTVTQTSGQNYDESFNVHQGYINYHPQEWMQVLLGRQVLSYGNDFILGSSDWNNIGRAFDGIRLRTKYQLFGNSFSDIWATKLVHNDEGTKTGTGSGDADFFGTYNGFDFGTYFKTVEPYFFYRYDNTNIVSTSTKLGGLANFGLRALSSFNGIDYRFEGDAQWGSAVPNRGYIYDIEVGYTFDGKMRPRFSLQYLEAGANFDQLYPSAHGFVGYANIFSRRNLRDIAAHAKVSITPDLWVQLDGHYFRRTSSDGPAYKYTSQDFGATLGSTSNSNSMFLGIEEDLSVNYQLTSRTNIYATVSLFQEGAFISDQNLIANGPPVYAMLQVQTYF